MKQKYDPVWKRWNSSVCCRRLCNVTSGYEQQLELLLNKPRDATPKEAEDCYEEELKWWGDRQLKIVAIATVVQISALGFMAAVMLFNQSVFG